MFLKKCETALWVLLETEAFHEGENILHSYLFKHLSTKKIKTHSDNRKENCPTITTKKKKEKKNNSKSVTGYYGF